MWFIPDLLQPDLEVRTASVSLPSLCDDKGIEVPASLNLELHIILIFLDLDSSGIVSSGCEQKVRDFLNVLRHNYKAGRRVCGPQTKQ